MSTAAGPIEVLTIGRVSVDLYAQQANVPARLVESFSKSIGGTTTNVAVAAARLGHRVATCTRVGDDEFGEFIRWALPNSFGVDAHLVGVDPTLKTPLAFVMLDPPEEPRVFFYREPGAPDMNITMADLDADLVRDVPILWIAASNLAYEPCRTTMHEVLALRNRRAHTVLDLDWRPMFWPSATAARAQIAPLLSQFSIVVGNRTEYEVAVETNDPEVAIERMLELGLEIVIVKLGGDGVLVADNKGVRERVKPVPIDVVCGVGAGDAFGGAFCHGLLVGWDLATCVQAGNAAGALVASRLRCADDMPTLEEVLQLMNTRS